MEFHSSDNCTYDLSLCVICQRDGDSSEQNLSVVTHGRAKLIQRSLDHSHVQLYEYLMSNPEQVLVHPSCRSKYVDEKRLSQ